MDENSTSSIYNSNNSATQFIDLNATSTKKEQS